MGGGALQERENNTLIGGQTAAATLGGNSWGFNFQILDELRTWL